MIKIQFYRVTKRGVRHSIGEPTVFASVLDVAEAGIALERTLRKSETLQWKIC